MATGLQERVRISELASKLGDARKLEGGFQEILQVDPNNPNVRFVLGMMAYRDGRHDAAAEAFRQAIALDPENADFHFGLGAACRALGQVETAAASYREAVRLQPDYAEAYHELGLSLAMQGRLDEAITCHRQALALRPNDASALASLGNALVSLGRFEEAEGTFRRVLEREPDSAEAHRNLGLIALRRGRYAEATTSFEQTLRLHPEDTDTRNELGIALSRQGRLGEAITCYREALRLKPDFADAHNNLGNALRNSGKHDEAVASFCEALRLRPNYPEAHNNLAITFRAQGKYDDAITSYHQALAQRPAYAEAHNNLGFALAHRGKHDAAVVCYLQATRLRPDYFEAYHNLGNALSELGQLEQAISSYRLALQIRPGEARVYKCMGITLSRQEKFDEAVTAFKEALRLRPDYADAWNDLGITQARRGQHGEAIAAYREALKARPDYAEACNNLGNALRHLGQFDESDACYCKALELRPGYADAHNNYGIALAEMGRFDEAIASYTRCIELRPNHVDAHMNRALTWLRKGDYAQGWAEYEWRWKKRALSNRPLTQPAWNGFPLAGRTILLITEQGFGDAIQFIRYARILKAQGARVVFECPEKLVKLMTACPGVDEVVPQGGPLPAYDVYAPLLTIPGLLGTSLEEIPNQVPYLEPDPALVEEWRTELAGVREFKVGINWQGNPKYAGDYHRSIPLKHFEALARIPGVKLYSLQKYDGLDQLKELAGRFPVEDLGSRLDDATGPFLDTSAVLRCLDLFITSDTSVVHLAGALGVPVWMALSTTPDWRWLSRRQDNPWYPSMRIFRQDRFQQWEPVFQRITAELRKIVPPVPTRSVTIEAAPGDLIDKITILELKAERLKDPARRNHVLVELEALRTARDQTILASAGLEALSVELRSVNETLWQIEDQIRACERERNFGPEFVELARSVYKTNDHRAALKRRINEMLGSKIVEEKEYSRY